VFYKNKHGVAARQVQEKAVEEIKESGWNPEDQDRLDASSHKTE